MIRFLPLLLLLVLPGCDSGGTDDGPATPDPDDPAGTFDVEPVWVRLSQRIAAGQVEDLQMWIDGSIAFEVDNGTVSGTGSCTVRQRRHRAWLGETSDVSRTEPFSASGAVVDGQADITFQGCAWAMARYDGSFADGRYSLELRDPRARPVWNPDTWSLAIQLEGDDPDELTLSRR